MRTLATFQSSAFNTSAPRDYFINPESYGDDLARWIIAELETRGVTAENDPGQEDFGWYIAFRVGHVDHNLVIGYRPGEDGAEGDWICVLERWTGVIGSLLGARNKGISADAARMIHEILSTSERIRKLRWHHLKEFDRGREDAGAPSPFYD